MAANDLRLVKKRRKLVSLDKWPVFCLLKEEFVHSIHSFIIYGETGNEVIVVTKDDVVFHMNVNNITQMTELSELRAKGVIKITSGAKHLCALTSGGDVYTWGDNQYYQLGTRTTDPSPHPLKLNHNFNNEKVVDIECGQYHSLVLTDAGHVYAWGYNNNSQLGNGNITNQSTPIQVLGCLAGCHVTSVVCGGYHSLAVTDTGSVFGWGRNVCGELGLGHNDNQLFPVQLPYFNEIKVIKVLAGNVNTVILSDEGNVYTFGNNNHGQLGTGNRPNRYIPVKLTTFNDHGPIVDITSQIANDISVAVTANGVLYVWGECRQPVGDLNTPTVAKTCGSMYDVFGLFAKTQATNRSIPLTLADDHPVLNSIAKAFDDRITSSFKFVIDGHPIHVHKEYLTIRCEPLRALLEINNSENTITDYSYEAFKAFLRYLYTNDVFVAPDIAVELLGLADTYAETDLKRKCTQLISNGITVENVSLIYGAAVKHKEPTLQDICFKYAVKNFENVSKTDTFNDLDINIYKDFIRKASLKGAFSR